jgi:hypothetical protein
MTRFATGRCYVPNVGSVPAVMDTKTGLVYEFVTTPANVAAGVMEAGIAEQGESYLDGFKPDTPEEKAQYWVPDN